MCVQSLKTLCTFSIIALQVTYYNVIITSAGKVEVKLRQSEIEHIESKMGQKQREIDFLTDELEQLKNKIKKLEQHLRKQKIGKGEGLDYSYPYVQSDELELIRLQAESYSTEVDISVAKSQKHQLHCERKVQTQEIVSIQKELSDENVRKQCSTL